MAALDVHALDTTTHDKMFQIRCRRHLENRIGLYTVPVFMKPNYHCTTYSIVGALAELK